MPDWIRVRSAITGHEFDVAPSAVTEDHTVLKDYPENVMGYPREPKFREQKGSPKGQPAASTAKADAAKDKE